MLKINRHTVRNMLKMAAQSWILPAAYALCRMRHRGEKTLYVFADAHHTELPFSLEAMHDHVKSLGIQPVCHFHDYTHEGALKSILHSIAFMDILAQAKYVFICDTFLPVSSGKKVKGTKIVQLCHFCGPVKKLGYATPDDVPSYYKGNVFANYDLVTASSETFVPLLTQAMRQPEGVVQALGVSRSDLYCREDWVESCRAEFYAAYPEARGKKILLWAPTFRGKAAGPNPLDNEAIVSLGEKLSEEWFVLIKHHPHDDAVAKDPRCRSNCAIATERLLPVVDLLITDYSTTFLDLLTFDKPFILYAPDLAEYEAKRGFFVDYRSITKNIVTDDTSGLENMVREVYARWENGERGTIEHLKEIFTAACDGHSTERILAYLEESGAAVR